MMVFQVRLADKLSFGFIYSTVINVINDWFVTLSIYRMGSSRIATGLCCKVFTRVYCCSRAYEINFFIIATCVDESWSDKPVTTKPCIYSFAEVCLPWN
jgi:hypothetical protein